MNKIAFIEDMDGGDGGGSYDFDWEGLCRALGEAEEKSGPDWSALGEALNGLFVWLIGGRQLKPGFDLIIGRRLIGLMWATNPDLFGGISLRALADKLGFSAPVLSTPSADASRKFGVVNGAKAHDWRKKKHVR